MYRTAGANDIFHFNCVILNTLFPTFESFTSTIPLDSLSWLTQGFGDNLSISY